MPCLRGHRGRDRTGSHGQDQHEHEVTQGVSQTALDTVASDLVVLQDTGVSLAEVNFLRLEALLHQFRDLSEGDGTTKIDAAGGSCPLGLVLGFHGRPFQASNGCGQDPGGRGVSDQSDHATKTESGLVDPGNTLDLTRQHGRRDGRHPVIDLKMSSREILKDVSKNGKPGGVRRRKPRFVGGIRTGAALVQLPRKVKSGFGRSGVRGDRVRSDQRRHDGLEFSNQCHPLVHRLVEEIKITSLVVA